MRSGFSLFFLVLFFFLEFEERKVLGKWVADPEPDDPKMEVGIPRECIEYGQDRERKRRERFELLK